MENLSRIVQEECILESNSKAQKRTGTTKTGDAAITKAMLADAIQGKLGTNQLPTLVKMSKNDLMTLAAFRLRF